MSDELSLSISPPSDCARQRSEVVRPIRMALVNMPWAWVDAPSIQCGLLQSIVRKAGHDCDVHYLNIDLAASLGPEIYNQVAEMNDDRFHQLGEWLFSFSAFGNITSDAKYFAEYPEVPALWSRFLADGPDRLINFRHEILPTWLESCLTLVDWSSYDAIGFTSTFLQNTSSLALGRKIKASFPDIPLIYGGANFDGAMGPAFAKELPWLDYVVCGEGDIALPQLLDEIAAGTEGHVPGVYRRGVDSGAVGEAARTQDLNTLPVPDYRDYFAALDRYTRKAVLRGADVRLPIELSRGCWWGEKHHCTFCGLNALGINYRSKTGRRALDELAALLQDYPVSRVYAVDNILDMKYVTSFCAELAERHWDIDMFFEVKANLTREQLGVLRRAGILRIQPGIESLSSHVLELMRKGATRLINVRLLKWARYYGIDTEWHLLSGFPGEVDEDYREQIELIPLISHLQPPQSHIGIWLERFSPYFTESTFPITEIQPQVSYQYVYPPNLDYSKIAYFFDYTAAHIASGDTRRQVGTAVDAWKAKWATGSPPTLFYQRLPGRLSIFDGRSDPPRRVVLKGWRGDAYEACGDTARSSKRIHQELLDAGLKLSLSEIRSFLGDCCAAGLMIAEDDKYLGLAIPAHDGW